MGVFEGFRVIYGMLTIHLGVYFKYKQFKKNILFSNQFSIKMII